ncbi:MAG: cytochrome c3 family protein, partial [Deltaproteobacteria bacterium]|nr:cytochrome c3 family protein [Deltaproteobacteria bacterium]
INGDDHLGWKNQHCEFCHTLPVKGHSEVDSPLCAACHGANGACDPKNQYLAREHLVTDNCIECHQNKHGFTESSDCQACHYAPAGRVDCKIAPADGGDDGASDGGDISADGGDVSADGGDIGGDDNSGPILSTALESNCFNWPEDEFSSTNKAGVGTALLENALAVELTLKDVNGVEYSLSALLAEKPVLLVFGSFT